MSIPKLRWLCGPFQAGLLACALGLGAAVQADDHDLARQALESGQVLPLAASLKSPDDVVSARQLGFTHLTLPLDVLQSMMEHPTTQHVCEEFNAEGVGLLDAG